MKMRITAVIISLSGLLVLGFLVSWWAALGVMMYQVSQNFEHQLKFAALVDLVDFIDKFFDEAIKTSQNKEQ